jgi:type III pantothenate kinase
MVLLGLVVGNSRLRFGCVDGARIIESSAIAWGELDARFSDVIAATARSGASACVAGSVRDDLLAGVERRLPVALLPVRVARRDFPLPIRNLYERPEEVGTDRLLGCVAALRRSCGRGAVVVDFGTAITVSVVAPSGDFLGGAIAGGAGTIARGLADGAPRLPRMRPGPCDARSEEGGGFISRDTASALRAGVYWQVIGGVRTLIAGALRALPFRPCVIATGGEAALFRVDLPEIEDVVEDLVLEGLALSAAEAGRLPAASEGPAP